MKISNANNSYSRYGSYYRNTGSSYSNYGGSRYTGTSYSNRSRSSYNRPVYGYTSRYNYTSEAFDFASNEMAVPLRRKPVRRRKVVYNKIKEAKPLSLPKTFATIAVIFCFVLILICLYASNSNSKTQLVELQDRLIATQEDNEYIKISIEENLDLAKIQQEAMKLGLQMPAEYQIVEINVPKDSYTVQYDSEKTENDEGVFSFLSNVFKG